MRFYSVEDAGSIAGRSSELHAKTVGVHFRGFRDGREHDALWNAL